MKKKEALLVGVMGIITVAVILTGFTYSRDQREELSRVAHFANQSQAQALKERKLQQQEERKAEFLNAFEENRKEATVADFLQYVDYNKEAVQVVYYGAITENAPWAEAGLTEVARGRDLTKVSRHYVSLAEGVGFSAETELEKVLAQQPDVVFLALPQEVKAADQPALEEAEWELFRAYDAIKAEAPDALLVLLSPVPAAEADAAEAETESALHTYVAHMKQASEKHGVGFYDLDAAVRDSLVAVGGKRESLFDEQQALNQKGNQVLQSAFSRNLEETAVDTSGAFQATGRKQPAESLVPEESSSEESELEEIWEFESESEASEESSLESESLNEVPIEESSSAGTGYVPPVYTPPVTPPASTWRPQPSSEEKESDSSSEPASSADPEPEAERPETSEEPASSVEPDPAEQPSEEAVSN